MSRRSNQQGQRLTFSWLDEVGIKERDLQERKVTPLAKVPVVHRPDPALTTVGNDHFKAMIRENRGDLLFAWATKHNYPQMRVQLPAGGTHNIVSGVSAWRVTCYQCSLEIVEAALAQSANFQPSQPDLPESEKIPRGALMALGRWRNWEPFIFKPTSEQPGGYQFTLVIGDGTEEGWTRFASVGLLAQVCEACDLLEREEEQRLLEWGRDRDYPELLFCRGDGSQGIVPTGEEGWQAFLAQVDCDDLRRAQMSAQAQGLNELEVGREE